MDELSELTGIDDERAKGLIMAARAHWFEQDGEAREIYEEILAEGIEHGGAWYVSAAYRLSRIAVHEDPDEARQLIENAEYIRCEIELAARREMITKLEDFMRRRSKIELVLRQRDIIGAQGLKDACAILFGDEAELRLQEYLDTLEQTAY